MNKLKIILTLIVVAAAVLTVQAVKRHSYQALLKRPVAVRPDARVKGAHDAVVHIIEYTDFQCPACAKASDTVDDLLKSYSGKILLQHKHFPLPMHKNAKIASVFAECAAEQKRFWPYHDVLFKSQTSWSTMEDPSAYFQDLAVQLGLDEKGMAACVSGPEGAQRIAADRIDGEIAGVKATPTFVIEGKLFVGAANLKTEIETRLGK